MYENFFLKKVILPEELSLNMVDTVCNGDDCNDNQGGCTPADASCGQDC